MPIGNILYTYFQRQKAKQRDAEEASAQEAQKTDERQQLIDKYKNTRFADIIAQNPYVGTYEPGFVDALGDVFGFGTTADEYEKAAREYDAQVAQLYSEEQYNSPAEMAEREKAAGMNPDLTGITGEPASEFDQTMTSPSAQGNFQILTGLGSSIMSVFSSAIAFAKDFESLKQLRNETEHGDIQNAMGMFQVANEFVRANWNPEDEGTNAINVANEWMKKTLHSKNAKLRWTNAVASAVQDLRNRKPYYDTKQGIESSRRKTAELQGSQYYSEFDEMYKDMIAPFVQLTERYNTKAYHNKEIYEGLISPEIQADAQNQIAENNARNAEFEKDVNSTMRKIIGNLSKSAENGNEMASIGLLLFQILRSVNLPALKPNINTGDKYFVKTE